MRLSRTTFAIVIVALFAGCISDGEKLTDGAVVLERADGAAPAITDVEAALERMATEGVQAPTWKAGYAWTAAGAGPDGMSTCTYVVTSASGGDYTLSTSCPSMAEYDALFDISFVGRIRADLAGAQDGTPVRFFDFPLKDGKTWTTPWDGKTVTLTATFDRSIKTAVGNVPGFHIVGLDEDGDVHVTYNYAPALRWWSEIDFGGYGLRVDRFQEGWAGEYYVATAEALVEVTPEAGVASMPYTAFSVGEEATALYLQVFGYSNHHARALVLLDPDNQQRHSETSAEPSISTTGSMQRFDAAPGDWKLASPGVNDPNGFYRVTITSIQVEARTFGPT